MRWRSRLSRPLGKLGRLARRALPAPWTLPRSLLVMKGSAARLSVPARSVRHRWRELEEER